MIIAITSIGLSLIFGTTGLSNFAHGEMVTFGAFVAWSLNSATRVSTSIPAAIVGDRRDRAARQRPSRRALWRPLRHRSTSLTSMMIVSIGIGPRDALHRSSTSFGGDLKAYSQYTLQPDPVTSGRSTCRRARCSSSCIASLVIVARGAVPAQGPLRQGDPGRVGQPRPRVVERHRHRPRHPRRLGHRRRARRPRRRASTASSSASSGTWASPCCC